MVAANLPGRPRQALGSLFPGWAPTVDVTTDPGADGVEVPENRRVSVARGPRSLPDGGGDR